MTYPSDPDTESGAPRNASLWLAGLTLFAAALAFGTVLAYHNLADGDLWGRLAAGAAVWNTGQVFRHDVFAFTPTLPQWIDHEWGSGLVFYGLLAGLGVRALMLLKIAAGVLALTLAFATGRRNGTPWPALAILALAAGFAVLPGYVPAVRSHAFTYLFFALFLGFAESFRRGARWPLFPCLLSMLAWANLHGGFVTGLGILGVYLAAMLRARQDTRWIGLAVAGSVVVTLVNPYGIAFWHYLLPALLHPRPLIEEWGPMPLLGRDAFTGFRILFVLVIVAALFGWKQARDRVSVPGRLMLLLSLCAAWSSKRHAPFFGLCALAYAGPWLGATLDRAFLLVRRPPASLQNGILVACLLVSLVVTARHWRGATLDVLAPVGFYPVREMDILERARMKGNLAVPFRWGSYAAWRLYPNIRVSCDGRYEETYPESTFLMNEDFFRRTGSAWDRLLRNHDVDFIVIDLRRAMIPMQDLQARGYEPAWIGPDSALMVRTTLVEKVREVAASLPPTSIQPLTTARSQTWPYRPAP